MDVILDSQNVKYNNDITEWQDARYGQGNGKSKFANDNSQQLRLKLSRWEMLFYRDNETLELYPEKNNIQMLPYLSLFLNAVILSQTLSHDHVDDQRECVQRGEKLRN